jgi:hypothetical protein
MKDPVLSCMTLVLVIYCLTLLILEGKLGRLVSPLALTAGLSLVHFGMPAVLQALDTGYAFINQDNEAYLTKGTLFVLCSLVATHIGVWGSAGWFQTTSSAQAPAQWRTPNVILMCALLSGLGWAARAYVISNNAYFQFARAVQGELEGPFYAAIRMVEQFPLHVLFILMIQKLRTREESGRSWTILVAVSMILEFAYWIPTGRKEESILILLVPMLLQYLMTGTLPSRTTRMLFLTFVAVLFPAAFYYRFVLQKLAVVTDDIWGLVVAAVTTIDGDIAEETEMGIGQIIVQRLDLLEPVSACVRLIEQGDWPLEMGISYAMALLAFVPRLFWPSKPDMHYGTDFGHASGLLTDIDDWYTSISVTFVGEAFLNFSWLGCAIFVLTGFGYGLLYERARASRYSPTAVLLYAIALQTILFLGGTFALYFGGLVKVLPLYAAVGWAMRGHRWSATRRRQESAHVEGSGTTPCAAS